MHILFFIILIAVSATASAAGDPTTCAGYPEKRVYLQSHGWWQAPGVAFPGKHVHLETCFPLHQKVKGIVRFDTIIRLHAMQNNGAINLVRVQIFNNGTPDQFTTQKSVNLSCSVTDCSWVIPIDVDTTRVPNDGRWEFRMTANVPKTAEGNRFYQTTRWSATLNNGKIVKNGESLNRSPGAAGWYTGVDYQNVFCGPNDGYSLVSSPKSGVVTIACKFEMQTAFASIDPNFHAGDPGKILLNYSTGGMKNITIDTRKLSNGPHKLLLRTDAKVTKPQGTASGVLVLPFTVAN